MIARGLESRRIMATELIVRVARAAVVKIGSCAIERFAGTSGIVVASLRNPENHSFARPRQENAILVKNVGASTVLLPSRAHETQDEPVMLFAREVASPADAGPVEF